MIVPQNWVWDNLLYYLEFKLPMCKNVCIARWYHRNGVTYVRNSVKTKRNENGSENVQVFQILIQSSSQWLLAISVAIYRKRSFCAINEYHELSSRIVNMATIKSVIIAHTILVISEAKSIIRRIAELKKKCIGRKEKRLFRESSWFLKSRRRM